MQPGMPQGFGTIGPDATPIFTLPGNPVSALVSFEVFVRPALRKMRGVGSRRPRCVTAVDGRPGAPGDERSHRLVRAGRGAPWCGRSARGSHLVADSHDLLPSSGGVGRQLATSCRRRTCHRAGGHGHAGGRTPAAPAATTDGGLGRRSLLRTASLDTLEGRERLMATPTVPRPD